MRRRRFGTWPMAALVLLVLIFYFYRDQLSKLSRPDILPAEDFNRIPVGGILSQLNITAYVNAIMDPQDTHLPRLNCRRPDLSRYHALQSAAAVSPASETPFFFALNLRENLPILPRLLGSVLEAIDLLGPERCALSVVEGNSEDGTAEVLAVLRDRLATTRHGLRTYFSLGVDIDPLADARFAKLAALRNLALQPLTESPTRYANATVLFLNDVAACPDDILELAHQRTELGADMICAMDWIGGDDEGGEPSFYDVYIARAINGDLFFDIPAADTSWSRATDLFWNDDDSRSRFYAGRPVQVFSCWNGAVAFTAAPVAREEVRFRAAREGDGECYNGEPEIFCKDMWATGHGRIAVLPYVNLEYSDEKGKWIKDNKGYTHEVTGVRPASQDRIDWRPPPEKVKCMPTFDRQYWVLWNDTNEKGRN